MCENPAVSWRATAIGSVLDKGIAAGKVTVRVTPENVIETLLCGKFDDAGRLDKAHADYGPMTAKRARIATAWRELSQGKMMPSFEYHLIHEFFGVLKAGHPSCVKSTVALDEANKKAEQGF